MPGSSIRCHRAAGWECAGRGRLPRLVIILLSLLLWGGIAAIVLLAFN